MFLELRLSGNQRKNSLSLCVCVCTSAHASKGGADSFNEPLTHLPYQHPHFCLFDLRRFVSTKEGFLGLPECSSQPWALLAIWTNAGRGSRAWESVSWGPHLASSQGTLALLSAFPLPIPGVLSGAGMRRWGQGLLDVRAPVCCRNYGDLAVLPFRAGFIEGTNHTTIWVSHTGKVSGCPPSPSFP